MAGLRHKSVRGSRKAKPLAVGQKGIVRIGNSRMKVEVVEDRGPLGVKGRRLVRIRVLDPESDAGSAFELPADQIRPAS